MSVTANQLQQTIVRNLGGAGRIVTKVISGLFDENNNTGGHTCKEKLLNKYGAVGSTFSGTSGTSQGRVTSNLKFNDHFLYPVDRKLSAVHFYDLTQSEGQSPFVSRDMYSGEALITSETLFLNRQQSDPDLGTRGKFFWQSWRLNRNERVSSRGIELYQTYNIVHPLSDADHTYTLKTWLEILKYATLENGVMSCYYA